MRAIVFVLRGCSAGWLGAYGNEWIATPHLDRLAGEGVTFDRCYSDCPDPVAADRAWRSGQPAWAITPPSADLLDILRTEGVPAVLVRANHPDTDAPEWFYAGWGEVFDVRPQEEDRFGLDSLIRTLPALLDRLIAMPRFLLWVEIDSLLPPWHIRQDVFEAYTQDTDVDDVPRPSSLVLREDASEEDDDMSSDEQEEDAVTDDEEPEANDDDEADTDDEGQMTRDETQVDEPATPWSDPPTGPFDTEDPAAREWLHASLAALVTGLDAELGLVFNQLRDRGLDRTAAWLLTSDFGYPLGEHDQIGRYRPWLHEELVHLPLILRLPDAAEACRRIAAFAQPPDIAPTLLAMLGVSAPLGSGANLFPAANGGEAPIRDCAITRLELGPAAEQSIRTDEWALLLPTRVSEDETREPQLFGKPDDRWEVNDLRSQNIERADELEARLRQATT